MFGGFFWLIALLVVIVVGAAGLWRFRLLGSRRRLHPGKLERRGDVGR
jgi:hypothetical protein